MDRLDLPVTPLFGSDDFHRRPYAAYEQFHRDGAPRLYRHPYGPELVLVGYDDLQTVLKHPSMQAQNRGDRSSGPSPSGDLARLFDAHPVFMNEPRHRPVRLAATSAIGVGRSDWLSAQIDDIVEDLTADLKSQGGGDLVPDFAFALSSRVWCRITGISESEAAVVQDCARKIAIALEFQPAADDLALADGAAATLISLMHEQQKGPGDCASLTLIADSLAQAPDPEALTEPMQLLASLTFDAVDGAGGMTGNFLHCLLKRETALASARGQRDDLSPFWTEAARLNPPLLGLFRSPVKDTDFDGFTLKAGENVLTLNASGNRDPGRFNDPDSYLPEREANRPLSFGFGSRGCIGRYLANMQGERGVSRLLEEFGELRLTTDEEDWGKPGLLRAIQSLPVEFG